jgi:hypothetical protein
MPWLTTGASGFPGRDGAGKTAVHGREGYHVAKAEIHHKSVGLTGGHHDLFMIDAIPKIFNPARMAGDQSETSTVLNKFGPSGHGEAQVQYLDGDFRVISPGTYVRCAVTDARIPLDELKYWSVDLQEAYAIPTAVLQRHFPAALKTQG